MRTELFVDSLSHPKVLLASTADKREEMWCAQTQLPGSGVWTYRHNEFDKVSQLAVCINERNHVF